MKNRMIIVLPCYNEEEILPSTCSIIENKFKEWIKSGLISPDSKAVFVDDGSKDNTWSLIKSKVFENEIFGGIKLSHNQGHQNSLMAGMMFAKEKCDFVITMDADLQDDIDCIPEFIMKYNEGCHIVYGVRKDRDVDSFFKKATASVFYKLMNFLGANTVYNHADFRLLSSVALDALSEYDEINLFLRGIVPLIGLKSDIVYYNRKKRLAGKTKYPVKKMIGFAFDGITSFSVKPLKMISLFGILCSVLSVGGLLYALISHMMGRTVPGWTAVVCSIWLLGGIMLLCMGVLGSYIGKLFSEVKHRPRYFIEDILSNEKTDDCNKS